MLGAGKSTFSSESSRIDDSANAIAEILACRVPDLVLLGLEEPASAKSRALGVITVCAALPGYCSSESAEIEWYC